MSLKKVGNPVELAKFYNKQGVDELVFLDITTSYEKREMIRMVFSNRAKEAFIPFTDYVGIRTI